MAVRAGLKALAAGVSCLLVVAGCGHFKEVSDDDRRTTTTVAAPDALCGLLVVALPEMRADGLSFADLVEDGGSKRASGISAGIAFAMMMREREHAGRFEPALGYLADRSVAETPSGGTKPPRLTAEVRANAKELDRFLADGGCG